MYDPTLAEWKGFVKAMRLARDDDTARLAFADYLQERWPGLGLDDLIRGGIEFWATAPGLALTTAGAVQTGSGRQTATFPGMRGWAGYWRAQTGWGRFWPTVPKCFVTLDAAVRARWQWVRGFPETVVCSCGHWIHWGDMLCSLGPVGEVILTDMLPMEEDRGATIVTYESPALLDRLPVSYQSISVDRREWGRWAPGVHEAHERMIAEKFLAEVWSRDEEGSPVESFRFDLNRRAGP